MKNRKIEIYYGDNGMGYDVYFVENGMIIKKEYYIYFDGIEKDAKDWLLPDSQK